MKASQGNWEDVAKYYKGCFVKFKEHGETLCLVEQVTPEAIFCRDEHGAHVAVELDGLLSKQKEYDLDFLIPKKTWYQYGQCATFLSRVPARMWKKGINKENTNVFALVDDVVKPQNLSFENLSAYVNKKHYLPPDKLSQHSSIALSPRFALSKSGNIYLDLTIVGHYDGNRVVAQRLFYKDVKALFPNKEVLEL